MDIILRPAKPADVPAMLAIYAPFVQDTSVSFEVEVPDLQEFAVRVEKCSATHAWIVAEDGGQVAGYAYGGSHRARHAYQWTAEVSVYIHPSWQRRGLGRVLYAALLELLKTLGYRRALGGITLPNPGSVALHTAMGFELVGVYEDVGYKMGQWWSTCFMQRALGPVGAPPIALRSPAMLKQEEWDTAWAEGYRQLKEGV